MFVLTQAHVHRGTFWPRVECFKLRVPFHLLWSRGWMQVSLKALSTFSIYVLSGDPWVWNCTLKPGAKESSSHTYSICIFSAGTLSKQEVWGKTSATENASSGHIWWQHHDLLNHSLNKEQQTRVTYYSTTNVQFSTKNMTAKKAKYDPLTAKKILIETILDKAQALDLLD